MWIILLCPGVLSQGLAQVLQCREAPSPHLQPTVKCLEGFAFPPAASFLPRAGFPLPCDEAVLMGARMASSPHMGTWCVSQEGEWIPRAPLTQWKAWREAAADGRGWQPPPRLPEGKAGTSRRCRVFAGCCKAEINSPSRVCCCRPLRFKHPPSLFIADNCQRDACAWKRSPVPSARHLPRL